MNDVVFGVQAWFRVGNLVLRIGVGGADGDLDGVWRGTGADDLVLRSQVGEGADSVVIWVLGRAVDLELLVGVGTREGGLMVLLSWVRSWAGRTASCSEAGPWRRAKLRRGQRR